MGHAARMMISKLRNLVPRTDEQASVPLRKLAREGLQCWNLGGAKGQTHVSSVHRAKNSRVVLSKSGRALLRGQAVLDA